MMMRILTFLIVIAAATTTENPPAVDTDTSPKYCPPVEETCSAQYGNFHQHLSDIQEFANLHLHQSYQYLLMASNFNRFEFNRNGFYKYFQSMSDSLWEDSIEIIKYITKRGGNVNSAVAEGAAVATRPGLKVELPCNEVELYELSSISLALKLQKDIAEKALSLHVHATKGHKNRDVWEKHPDAELAHYLEKEFVTKHSERVRELAGLYANLKEIIGDKKQVPNLGIYLFDQLLH